MKDNKQYLFLFSIGPVQSFIAQARKTQDLYAGSQILSVLAKAGLKAVNSTDNKDNYIFPNKYDPNTDSIPNRFLCIISANDTNEIKEKGKLVEKAVIEKWHEIAKPVLDFTNIKGVKEQIDNHLDINWAFVEIENTEGGYAKAYEKIERLLGAVKNARSFTQFTYQGDLGEKGRKCSLDGERNVKFYRLKENEKKEDALRKKLFMNIHEVKIIKQYEQNTFTLSELEAGEGLSAVSMVKRKYKKNSFPSTAEIALKYQVQNLTNKNLYDCYKILFSDTFTKILTEICTEKIMVIHDEKWRNNFDDHLLFEENLTPKNVPNESQLKIAKKIQENFKEQLKHRYYALIDFDGDNMGKWLSGVNINEPKNNLKDFHKKLSEKLAEFAKKAKEIVDNYGQTIYAGGDDFLGFVNLNYLFKAMQELRNKFKELVNDSLHDELKYLNGELSFSAGVCIAHYKEPLSMVLTKAAAAQKTAKHKEKGDRNAFSIVAAKHSGENHEAYFKWENDCKNVHHLNCIVQNLTSNAFSNTFIKVINIEFERLIDDKGKLLVSDAVLEAEVKRTVKRSCILKKDTNETQEAFKQRKDTQCQIVANVVMDIFDASNHDFLNFLNALNICDFLHRLLETTETQNSQKQELQTA